MPFLHHDNLIRNIGDHGKVVTDEQHANITLLLQRLNQSKNLCLNGDVKRRCRLVRYQQFWLGNQCHRDHNSLAHTTRKLKGVGIHRRLRVSYTNLIKEGDSTSCCRLFIGDAVH